MGGTSRYWRVSDCGRLNCVGVPRSATGLSLPNYRRMTIVTPPGDQSPNLQGKRGNRAPRRLESPINEAISKDTAWRVIRKRKQGISCEKFRWVPCCINISDGNSNTNYSSGHKIQIQNTKTGISISNTSFYFGYRFRPGIASLTWLNLSVFYFDTKIICHKIFLLKAQN